MSRQSRTIRRSGLRPIGAYNVLRDLERAQPAAVRTPANTNRASGSKSVVAPFRRVAIEIPQPRRMISVPTAPKIAPVTVPEPEVVRRFTPPVLIASQMLRPPPPTPVRPATVLQWQFRPQSRRQQLVLVAL